jgi:hypothetical protein
MLVIFEGDFDHWLAGHHISCFTPDFLLQK